MLMALPMATYVFYIVLLGILNFITRLSSARKRQVHIKYFKTYQGEAPESVITIGRHFDNQFQVPLLFMLTCLSTHVFGATNSLAIWLSWIFIGSRMAHTFIHLTSNNVSRRGVSYLFGVLCVLGMWINILFTF